MHIVLCVLSIAGLCFWSRSANASQLPPPSEQFTEELLLQPLPDGSILAKFHFEASASSSPFHTAFPPALDNLALATLVRDFHLTLTQGRWYSEKWGRQAVPIPAPGARLRARFDAGMSEEAVAASWSLLSHGLSGLYCGSLNFLDSEEHKLRPVSTFSSSKGNERGNWVHGSLPREAVCTENLTPWLRLLACRDTGGLGAMLHGPKVFASPFSSLGVSLTVEGRGGAERHNSNDTESRSSHCDCTEPDSTGGDNGCICDDSAVRLKFVQTLTLILVPDRPRLSPPLRKPQSWDLASLFGSSPEVACPVAIASRVFVQLPPRPKTGSQHNESAKWALSASDENQPATECLIGAMLSSDDAKQAAADAGMSPAPAAACLHKGSLLLEYHLPRHSRLPPLELSQQLHDSSGEIGSRISAGNQEFDNDLMVLTADMQVAGQGEERGTLVVHANFGSGSKSLQPSTMPQQPLAPGASSAKCASEQGCSEHSNHQKHHQQQRQDLQLCLLLEVPWWAQLWLHTMRISYDNKDVDASEAVVSWHVVPGDVRSAPMLLEPCLTVPAATHDITLSISFRKAFLTVYEHPADASRGMDLPPVIATLKLNNGCRATKARPVIASSPLFSYMALHHVDQVSSNGAVVQLAQPDFSMPYNVCCLTSTVLALYFGALVNVLMKRSLPEQTAEEKNAAKRRRKLRIVLVLIAFTGAAVWIDKGLQTSIKQLFSLE